MHSARTRRIYSSILCCVLSFCAALPGGEAETSAPTSKNILRITRFPLGLQSGWSIGRELSDGDVVEVDSDESVRGPSGSPALRIKVNSSSLLPISLIPNIPIPQVPVPSIPLIQEEKASHNAQVYSAPFSIMQQGTHTASVFIKGSTKGKITVVCEGRSLNVKAFDLNGERWQRVEIPFKPLQSGRVYGLRIEGAGKFWIDSLQVERAERATEYEPPAKCEVALACASKTRVIFSDEDAEIRFAVTGEPERGFLKMKAVNIYGEEEMLQPVQLGREFWSAGKFRCDDIFRDKPYGPLRIEAWVESKSGQLLSTMNELVVYRLRRPHYWKKDAPASPFGVHTLSTNRHIEMAKSIGINWVRLHDAGTEYLGWYHLERKKGDWNFQDAQIERYRLQNMKILGVLETAPEWASRWDKRRNLYFDRFYEPKKYEDFAHYVSTIVKRYKSSIDAFEIWNEPWRPQFWHTSFDADKGAADQGYIAADDAEARYAELMRASYRAAKSADKNVRVLGFNTAANAERWTAGVLAKGAMNDCDVISYHHYTNDPVGAPGDSVEKGWKEALGPILDKEDGKLPKHVWLTEGSPTAGMMGTGFYKHTIAPENENLADISDRLCRYVISALGQNVQKVFLYSMHTHSYFGVKNEWRTLVTEEGYLHPSAAAYSAMAWQLEDTRFEKSAQLAEGLTAYFFEGKERSVAVISPAKEHAPFALPNAKDIEYSDLFGNPLKAGDPVRDRLIYVTAKGERLYKLTALLGAK